MPGINKRSVGPLSLAAILISFGYVAAQQQPRQQSRSTQGITPQSAQAMLQQQNDQLRDQLVQLQMQLKDLQAAIDDLKSEQQVIVTAVKETRGLVLDTSVAQKRDRADLDSLVKAVGRNDRGIDSLGRQLDGTMRDLQRVKNKVGLF